MDKILLLCNCTVIFTWLNILMQRGVAAVPQSMKRHRSSEDVLQTLPSDFQRLRQSVQEVKQDVARIWQKQLPGRARNSWVNQVLHSTSYFNQFNTNFTTVVGRNRVSDDVDHVNCWPFPGSLTSTIIT